jgi:hypothetical protein
MCQFAQIAMKVNKVRKLIESLTPTLKLSAFLDDL